MSKLNPAKFIREVRQEMSKVTWPTRRETTISTLMVLGLGALAATLFLLIDAIIAWAIRLILGLGS